MRKIGQIQDDKNKALFISYLFSFGIESHVDEDSHHIWIIKDEDRFRAKELFDSFVEAFEKEGPTSAAAMEIQKQAALGLKKLHDYSLANQVKEKKLKAMDHKARRSLSLGFEWFSGTGFLLGFSVLVFLFCLGPGRESLYRLFLISQVPAVNPFAIAPLVEVRSGEFWRLLTPIFLHHDFFHIIFNMMWLYQLGALIEKKEGTSFFLFLVVAMGVFSNLSFYFVASPSFGGMSGVIYGFIAYIWAYKKVAPMSSYFMDQGLVRFFVFWYGFCLVLTIFGFGVANTVHGAGALSGAFLGFVQAHRRETIVFSVEKLLNPTTFYYLAVITLFFFATVYVDSPFLGNY